MPSRAAPSAGTAAYRAFRSRVPVRATADRSYPAKLAFWERHLAYDPTGAYGAPAHQGQATMHRHVDTTGVKVVVVRAGKRAGKSTAMLAEGAFELAHGGKVWVVSATLDLTKPIFNKLWELALHSPYIQVTHKDRAKMRLDLAGGGFLKAASWGEDLHAIEAEPATLILGDEFQKAVPEVFDRLITRTVDTAGRLILAGSEQETSPDFDDLCAQAGEFEASGQPGRHNWRFCSWATWDNPHIPPEELAEERARLSEVKFNALYGAQRRPNYTLVFPEFGRPEHVRELIFLEDRAVCLWVDPGFNYYAALPVQFAEEPNLGETIRVFDEVYLMGTTTDAVVRECKDRPWYGRVEEIVIDHAAHQHTASAKLTTAEEWFSLTKLAPRSQRVSIPDGIERTHTALRDPQHGRPRIYFDPRCVNTIDEFRAGYRYRKPRDGDRPVSDRPLDRDNHAAKAIAYGLIDRYGLSGFRSYGEVADQNYRRGQLSRPRGGSFWDRWRDGMRAGSYRR